MGRTRALFHRAPLFAHVLRRVRIAGAPVAAARLVRGAALLLLAAAGPALAHGPGAFDVEDPRVRVDGGQAFVYATLINKESRPLKIVGAVSPAAERVELRQGKTAVASIEVAARGTLELVPGGYTAALLKLMRSLSAGDLVPVLLRLNDGDTFAVMATVVP